MDTKTSRRRFLRTVPVAAAVGFTLKDGVASAAVGQAAEAVPFQFFSSKALDEDMKALQAAPGNKNLIDQKAGFPCAIVMTTEAHKSATEFEWHEGRDHIVQVIDGMTLYEVGGTPKNGRNTKPGEWLAPASDGAKSIMMMKGDTLVIPRGTPHKRSTEDSVTFVLISPYGVMKA